jgi:hypothetical protein
MKSCGSVRRLPTPGSLVITLGSCYNFAYFQAKAYLIIDKSHGENILTMSCSLRVLWKAVDSARTIELFML